MKNESTHLTSGLLFGALIGACATYLIIKHKDSIKRELEYAGEKVKHGVHEFAEKAKVKAEEFGNKAKEKADEYSNKSAGYSDYSSQNLNDTTKSKTY